jgi:hypothetical protein
MSKSKSITLMSLNSTNFINWLKKFNIIEKSLLLEVDTNEKTFIAKSYNDEKSIIKFSKISFEEAGFMLNSKTTDFIKLGIYSIGQLIKSLNTFSENLTMTINYDTIKNDNGEDENAGLSILIKNDELKVKVECTSLNIFKYISDTLFKNICTTDEITRFDLSKEFIEKINNLLVLDKDYKFFEFIIKNNKVYIKGKTFELELAENGDEKALLSIYKEQFEKIDKENYNVIFGDDKMVFSSYDTDTTIVLSMAIKDIKYEEMSTEF